MRMMVAVLFLALTASVAAQAPQKEPNRSGATEREQQSAQRAPLSVRIVEDQDDAARRRASEDAAREDRKAQADAQSQSVRAAWAQAIFGFLTFVLLFITLIYTARAAKAAERSADAAQDASGAAAGALEHTVEAAKAATRSATAAERTIEQGQQQFNLSNRPWATISPEIASASQMRLMQEDGSIVETDGLVLIPIVRNIGRLPAKRMQLDVSFDELPANSTRQWPEPTWSGVAFTVAPGQRIAADRIPIPAETVDRVFNRATKFAVIVNVRYLDPQNDQEHQSVSEYELDMATPYSEVAKDNMSGVQIRPLNSEMA